MIDKIDFAALEAGEAEAFEKLRRGVLETGFLRVANTPISKAEALKVIEAYAAFFKLPAEVKSKVDMARTGSNRGWGASGSEQVDPMANPDYKEVFDCGFQYVPIPFKAIWDQKAVTSPKVLNGAILGNLPVGRQCRLGLQRAVLVRHHQE